MKGLLIVTIIVILNSTYGKPTVDEQEVNLSEINKLRFDHGEIDSKKTVEDILTVLNNLNQTRLNGSFNVEINGILDGILENLKDIIIHDGMDPMELANHTLGLFPIGNIKLISGWLQNISSIERDGDVVINFQTSTRKVTFLLPLNFKVILFTYKYHTKIAFLSMKGDVQGKIDAVKLFLEIAYDPTTITFNLNQLSMRNSGQISVKFIGNGLLDWMTNAMTTVVTTVLHPILIGIVQSFIRSAGSDLIEKVNEYVHPPSGLQDQRI